MSDWAWFGRYEPGYGVVVLVAAPDQSPRLIYLAGDPPDRVRESCERIKDDLVALVEAHGQKRGLRLFHATYAQGPPKQRLIGRLLKKPVHSRLKRAA